MIDVEGEYDELGESREIQAIIAQKLNGEIFNI